VVFSTPQIKEKTYWSNKKHVGVEKNSSYLIPPRPQNIAQPLNAYYFANRPTPRKNHKVYSRQGKNLVTPIFRYNLYIP